MNDVLKRLKNQGAKELLFGKTCGMKMLNESEVLGGVEQVMVLPPENKIERVKKNRIDLT